MRAVVYEGAEQVANKEVEAASGYAGMAPYRGAHAELPQVPLTDVNCVKLPGKQQVLPERGPPR